MLFKKYVENADGAFIVVTCADCNRPLLNIIKTEDSEDVHFINRTKLGGKAGFMN